ncbi:MAG: TatD family hydrolase [Acidilobaceae archaeon]
MASSLPVADGHCHSSPARGLGARAVAERFKRAGGWFIALVSLSPPAYGIEDGGLEAYLRAVEAHVRECRAAREEGVEVACIAGFHPAEVDKLVDRHRVSPARVVEIGFKVIDYIASLVEKGLLDGIGEVGRQHYKTSSDRVLASHMIMEYAIERARDLGAVVHLHLEQSKEDTVAITDRAIERLKPVKHKIVFHHSDLKMAEEAWRRGYSSTIVGLRQPLEYALSALEPVYMVESDYLDDPSRPGAVTQPWEMARLVHQLAEREEWREKLYRVNVDQVLRVYDRVKPP